MLLKFAGKGYFEGVINKGMNIKCYPRLYFELIEVIETLLTSLTLMFIHLKSKNLLRSNVKWE